MMNGMKTLCTRRSLLFSALPVGAALAAVRPGRTTVHALDLILQKRIETRAGSGEYRVVTAVEKWETPKAAIIVCDMWDLHHCKNAVRRVGEMAPRMNQVLVKARAQGVAIVHAP